MINLPSVTYANIRAIGRITGARSSMWLRHSSAVTNVVDNCEEYLTACKTNNASINSTVFRGSLYEFTTKAFLETKLKCFSIIRKGGAFDNGVDLVGKWDLSHFFKLNEKSIVSSITETTDTAILPIISNSKELNILLNNKDNGDSISIKSDVNVLVQCKNHKTKIQANIIRELVGIYLHHIKTDEQKNSTFMILVSPAPLTKQAQSIIDQTSIPLIHMIMSPLTLTDKSLTGDARYNIQNWQGGNIDSIYLNSYSKLLLKYLNIEVEFQKLKQLILI